MKVLFLAHEDDKFGAPKAMMELIRELKKTHGIEPYVIVQKKNNLVFECEKENIECKVINFFEWGHIPTKNVLKNTLRSARKKFFNFKSRNKIIAFCKKNHIELIHTNVSIIDVGFEAAKKLNIPHVWHIRESGIESNWHHYEKRYLKKYNDKININIVISNFVKTNWMNKGLKKENTFVIYDGVLRKKTLSTDISQPKKTLKLVMVGSITEHKGQVDAIKAIELLKNKIPVHLDIIGEGSSDYESKLKKYVMSNNLDENISFIGYKNNINNILNQYNIGLICSKAEAFGRVTVEYMYNRLPVIASDTGANPEIVVEGITGKLYNYSSSESLAEKIEFMFYHKENLINFGIEGYTHALNNYSISNHAANVKKVYVKMLKNH